MAAESEDKRQLLQHAAERLQSFLAVIIIMSNQPPSDHVAAAWHSGPLHCDKDCCHLWHLDSHLRGAPYECYPYSL